MTITCFACGLPCTGEVLKVQDRHFHVKCFVCKACNSMLVSGGYFVKDGEYYCSKDYHICFGTKCKTCGEYVEGRVVSALGHSYHPHCFTCDRCKDEIRSGMVVTYSNQKEILCQKCAELSKVQDLPSVSSYPPSFHSQERHTWLDDDSSVSSKCGSHSSTSPRDPTPTYQHYSPATTPHSQTTTPSSADLYDFSRIPDVDQLTRSRMGRCAGCKDAIRTCQSLLALERHWHLFCFVCSRCKTLLTSEYMNNDDKPFCENCFQEIYGLICDCCQEFITGKVLEAGEKTFHPTCATCMRCNLSFGEGEDMCISGDDIWHQTCTDRAASVPAIGTRTDSSSSEGSQSHRSTVSPLPDSSSIRSQRTSSRTPISRESSAGEVQHPLRKYPLSELKLVAGVRLPRDVNRTKLEMHLSDKDFRSVFKMERNAFYQLAPWKQTDLKKRANLF